MGRLRHRADDRESFEHAKRARLGIWQRHGVDEGAILSASSIQYNHSSHKAARTSCLWWRLPFHPFAKTWGLNQVLKEFGEKWGRIVDALPAVRISWFNDQRAHEIRVRSIGKD